MGQMLSEPVTEKYTTSGEDDRFKWAATGMQGWRLTMEDSHTTLLELENSWGRKIAFFSVFDGHGGSNAARWAGKNVPAVITETPEFKHGDYAEALRKGYLHADFQLRNDPKSMKQPSGCTAISCLFTDDMIYCANAGDSRAVLSNAGNAVPLSFDHKPTNAGEYARITAAGGFIEYGRVNGTLALSRALGDFEYKNAELLPAEEQIVTANPDVISRKLEEEDEFVVIACDGIWDCMQNQEIVEFISQKIAMDLTLEQITEELTTACLAEDSMCGIGCDNMTVIIVAILRGKTYQEWVESIKARVVKN